VPFTTTIIATVSRTRAQESTIDDGSISIPIDTKKIPENTSRIGAASPRMRCDRSDSPTTTPVRNAPSASDTPSSDAPPAIASASVTTASAKNSRLRNAEARRRSRGRSQNASGMTTTKKTAALPSSGPAPPDFGEESARIATIATLEMSCTEDHASASRAWRVSISPRSESTLPSTVLDELEITAPKAYDCIGDQPSARPTA
jgi:hypothetical protein